MQIVYGHIICFILSKKCYWLRTTCSSSVLELSSGIVSGKFVSFGDDTHP